MFFIVGSIVLSLLFVFFILWSFLSNEDPILAIGCLVLYVVTMGAFSIYSGTYNISSGYVGIEKFGGAIVENSAIKEGFEWVSPWRDIVEMDTRRFSFDFTTDDNTTSSKTVALSNDNNPINIEASFPITLNPDMAWKVLQKIGDDNRWRGQLEIHAQSAIREAVVKYPWREATSTKITELSLDMQRLFQEKIVADLINLGFTEDEANKTFNILPVNLRKSLPDAKILEAISNKEAAKEDLERQQTLTSIAKEEAIRRETEGQGITALVNSLPTGVSIQDIVALTRATADATRANAILKSVELNGTPLIIMDGGSGGLSIQTK